MGKQALATATAMGWTRWVPACAWAWLVAMLFAASASAHDLPGDLDGDGAVGPVDETLLASFYGSSAAAPSSGYEPAADLDEDGAVDLRDLALLGAAWGETGNPDDEPPALFVTVNDLPDDMNDLVVVPPDGFAITLDFSSDGGSMIDLASLSVTSSHDLGPHAAGSELAGEFVATPTRAVFEVPPGSDLDRTSHWIDVEVSDLAGNRASGSYGFAVRDFGSGAPLANLQTIFLDFDQDRSLGPDVDFLEDMRAYGLSTAGRRILETSTRHVLVDMIVARVNEYFGIGNDGVPGPNAVNVAFTSSAPAGPHARLCVGGRSDAGPLYLGNSVIDVENISETDDTCSLGAVYGVFPQAIRELWGADDSFHDAFDAVDPGAGGVPLGDDPLDAVLLGQGFSSEDLKAGVTAPGRAGEIASAVDAFTQLLAGVIAHEVGHLLGLSAAGDLPAGLYGGAPGSNNQDHNVTPYGGLPYGNYLMNRGSSFSFDEMTGRGGASLPVFRPLSLAYLHDRIVLSSAVTGLHPAPRIDAIAPSPLAYAGPFTPASLTFYGSGFLQGPLAPSVTLVTEGDPTPNPVTNLQWIDAGTLSGQISPLLVPPGLYDVELLNGDGQVLVLPDALEVLAP